MPTSGAGAQLKARKAYGIGRAPSDVISTSGNNPMPPPPPSGQAIPVINQGHYTPEQFTYAPQPTQMDTDTEVQYPGDADMEELGSSSGAVRMKKNKIKIRKDKALIAADPPVLPINVFKQMSRELQTRRQEEAELIAMNIARNLANTTNSASSSAQTWIQQQAERQLGADQVAPAPSAIPTTSTEAVPVAEQPKERSRSTRGRKPEPEINIPRPQQPERGQRSSSPAIATTSNTEERSRSRSTAVFVSRLQHGEGGATSVIPFELKIGEPERYNIGSDNEDTHDTAEKREHSASSVQPEKKARASSSHSTSGLTSTTNTKARSPSAKSSRARSNTPNIAMPSKTIGSVAAFNAEGKGKSPSRSRSRSAAPSDGGLMTTTSTTTVKPKSTASSSTSAPMPHKKPASRTASRSLSVQFKVPDDKVQEKVSRPIRRRGRLQQVPLAY